MKHKKTAGSKGFSPFKESPLEGKRKYASAKYPDRSLPEKTKQAKRYFKDTNESSPDDVSNSSRSADKKHVKKSAYGKPVFEKGYKNPNRETPSGFNRQKFMDTANERFATKQLKKEDKKKSRDVASLDPNEMPLNKYIAHSGICSRRKAVELIKEGKVTVNGNVVLEPATKVLPTDSVKLSNKKINITKNLVYILLNKPKGYITTTDDPEGRKTVMDLIVDAPNERVYPVGRLDRNTSGLLLLTNDGDLAQKLAHPSFNIKKIYQVELDKPLTKSDSEKIMDGITLEDGITYVDALGYTDPKDKRQLGIEIHSGKNRIVRRIFEHMGYNVEKLDRVMYAGLTKKNLPRGKWRLLSEKEVILLKHFK
ncbi:pseudouridine synthase [Chitinophaga caeni]|uniref:Pseudouridine synthase n=1 Tax=Chitinophaga caeni TaxID=2029983 RepID=A0A291QQA6_9BACT|nr:pseudouridine synthase [Chitinophaga caeni]ATL46111.1 pseudouridine synthase [Chitinophaga caeni]